MNIKTRPSRFFWIMLFTLWAINLQSQESPKSNVEDIYQNLCMSCHVSGAVGGSLTDKQWSYGGSDDEIFQSIKNGKEEKGMVPFSSLLTDEQIRGIVVYIRELESRDSSESIPNDQLENVVKTQYHSYKVEVLTTGFRTPWSLAFLPDGRKLVTERLGPIHIVNSDNTLNPNPIDNTPNVIFDGPEGGMMDIALHPNYKKNGWIYLAFADGWRDENGRSKSQTAIVRGRIKNHKWVDQEWIYKADPKFYMRSGAHYGTRIAFDKGYIYFVIGERGAMGQAQDLTLPNGKIFRLYDDGRIPADNPFIKNPDVPKGIWSYGHRNPQGLVVDEKHNIYATEHGARGGDEFNLILEGRNYGWPIITHGINYNGQPITSITEKEGMEQPLLQWTPSIAPCGLTQYKGSKFSKWKNDFFAGSLRAQELHRIRVVNGKVVQEEIILKGLGRIRDVRTGPDGYLYLLTDEPARLIRLVPSE
ncbi:PQQ-dependent sugar dehydrogenase [Tamlana flava]|uniref:PQQ-dependent sugar dehydrogenase n=1 Tax=Tamlana flava TaxID=3158572 RepID=UPI00351BB088